MADLQGLSHSSVVQLLVQCGVDVKEVTACCVNGQQQFLQLRHQHQLLRSWTVQFSLSTTAITFMDCIPFSLSRTAV